MGTEIIAIKNLEPMLTIQQVAKRLNCSQQYVYKLVWNNVLLSVKISSGMRRVDPAEFEKFLENRKKKHKGS